ncbi:MAG: NADH-ubiquinone oxidoreductase-F iron-sulfur binding region domain-containing protein [Candidatus Peribacteraceae bacterium]
MRTATILGRGGAEYPAYKKWEAVRAASSTVKYVICNASEREPNVFKDFHILENHTEEVFAGMKLAMQAVGAKEGIFNMNAEYEDKLKTRLDAQTAAAKDEGFTMRIFREEPSYIGGEETALLNAIEGKRCEPRLRPPYPVMQGLYGKPTLVHNVETLYDAALVSQGRYDGKRFYSVSGLAPKPGVYRLPTTLTALQVLQESGNVPQEAFFAQVGGGASGVVLNAEQLAHQTVHGTGAIILHLCTEDPRSLLLHWLTFYQRESCGKCTPCREGTYQLVRLVEGEKRIPWKKMQPILDVLEKTSFCALGRSVPVPILSYYQNVFGHS